MMVVVRIWQNLVDTLWICPRIARGLLACPQVQYEEVSFRAEGWMPTEYAHFIQSVKVQFATIEPQLLTQGAR